MGQLSVGDLGQNYSGANSEGTESGHLVRQQYAPACLLRVAAVVSFAAPGRCFVDFDLRGKECTRPARAALRAGSQLA